MKKTIRVGTIEIDTGRNIRQASIFCKIEFNKDKFSISGVVGPKSNGDALGSCGQIDMGFEHRNQKDNDKRYSDIIKPKDITFAPGWDAEKWFDFLDVWKKWHLNDMKANCEHQVGPEWEPQDVTLYHFELNEDTEREVKQAKSEALKVLEDGNPFKPSKGQIKICALKGDITYHKAKLPTELAPYYQAKVKKYDWQKEPQETKSTSWLEESEHPKGYLSKACPVCDYKYGSAWKKVEVPESVIKFIDSLPETDKQPAWV